MSFFKPIIKPILVLNIQIMITAIFGVFFCNYKLNRIIKILIVARIYREFQVKVDYLIHLGAIHVTKLGN